MASKKQRVRKKDHEIYELVKEAHEQEMAEFLEEYADAEEHVFSAEFERKMEELFARIAKNIRHREIRRYAVAAAVVIFILWSVSHPQYYVEATRVIIEWVEERFAVLYISEPMDGDIGEYRLGYVPEGFELVYQFENEKRSSKIYTSEKNGIEFSYSKGNWRAAVNGENIKLKDVPVDLKKEPYFLESDDLDYYSTLIWMSADGNILFGITSNIEHEELMKIYESVEAIVP